jgi:hypothetical protein
MEAAMSLTYDEKFRARKKAHARSKSNTTARRAAARRAIEEFEFSEWGRDPRFLPGWFLIPGFAIAAVMAVFLIALA